MKRREECCCGIFHDEVPGCRLKAEREVVPHVDDELPGKSLSLVAIFLSNGLQNSENILKEILFYTS